MLNAYRSAIRLRSKLFSVGVAGAFRNFGPQSVVELPVRINGERRISIGARVFVGAGCWLQVLDARLHGANQERGGVAISIGDGTSIVGSCVLSAVQSIEIGANALFARGVYIADHSHAFENVVTPILQQGIKQPAGVSVGEGAWLGENVVVLPGVRIGRGAVVGANSVVTSDVAEHTVVAGAPARELRRFGPPS